MKIAVTTFLFAIRNMDINSCHFAKVVAFEIGKVLF
jgi:hypothetical protein